MNDLSLAMTFSLVLLALFLSQKNKIGLEKELVVGSIRAVVQLTLIGFVLTYVFNLNNYALTTLLLVLMVYNAATVAAKRGQGIDHILRIAFTALLASLVITLGTLLFFGAIHYQPSEVIPISGMVVGNSMVAAGLVFNSLRDKFQHRRDEVEIKLCLGANAKESSVAIIRETIRTAMLPNVDSMKTLGIVQLPGMMTGLILAGLSPMIAIKYQIMVTFMITGAVAITTFSASYWAYKSFFNELEQLQ
ncbi:putative iron export permease protein FetB [bioreactor metagenome]|uniref:Putative iron export permease protein FetB n=1 Tax=bioreactor metagenome TaxID=1076179 RepID=A0A644TMC9_9ZZZZ|nr:iron export ABC transporter permease subunit FetB [Negativicutes bacterium]